MNDIHPWIEKPVELIQSLEVVPRTSMSKSGLLNAMTRLILIITLVLFLIGISGWWLFLILSLGLILLIWYTTIRETEQQGK